MMKTCRTCHRSKAQGEYSPHKDFKDGLDPSCKACRSILSAARRYGGLTGYAEFLERRIQNAKAKAGVHRSAIEKYASRKAEVERIEGIAKEVAG